MVRETNKAGCFIRLGVIDAEEKRYSICIPKGRGERGGWSAMAEVIQELIASFDKKENKKEETTPGKLQVEIGKRRGNRDRHLVRVEVEEEEISRNLSRLGHCLVGRWNPRVAKGENLERLGWLMVSSWRLKGKLGLAWLEEGRVLLEFELVEEARRVLTSGKRSVGGIQVGLELWNPRYGCLEEKEIRNEVWVRIMGLPISLWVPSILRRVGEECSGFLAIDPLTERMENLRWARILVKSNAEELPSSLEIGVEETTYCLPFWWEVLPLFRQNSEGYRGSTGRSSGEVRGDGGARADPRVKERVNARLEALSRTADGFEGQVDRAGRDLTEGWIQFGSMTRFSVDGAVAGPSLTGLAKDTLGLKWTGGPLPQSPSEGVILKKARDGGVGPEVGPMGSKGKEKVSKVEIGPRFGLAISLRKSNGPSLTHLKDFGVQSIGPSAILRDSHGPTEF